MANTNIVRGSNSQQAPAAIQHPQLSPGAAEEIARYSAVWEQNAALHEENGKLRAENEMLRRLDAEKTAIISDLRRNFEETVRASDDRIAIAEAHFHERIAEADRNKEVYLRYTMQFNERLTSGIEQFMAAREIAKKLAYETEDKRPPEPVAPPKKLNEIEQMIAEAVTDARGVALDKEASG
jgi:DNA-binding Lrp family transcriptional regulator